MSFSSFVLAEYLTVLVRTAACIMFLPGFSMGQIAMQIRLYMAIALSLSVYLLVHDAINIDESLEGSRLAGLVFSEILIAFMLAIPIRLFLLSLSFLGEIVMQMIGLNPIPGTPIGDDQATTVLSSLFNLTAVTLFFSSGLVISFVGALVQSFILLPPGEVFLADGFLHSLSENVSEFFKVILRLAAPLVIFSVAMNLVAGLVNKLSPQIPVYFVSTPFLICGGLFVLAWIGDDILMIFHMELQKLVDALFS